MANKNKTTAKEKEKAPEAVVIENKEQDQLSEVVEGTQDDTEDGQDPLVGVNEETQELVIAEERPEFTDDRGLRFRFKKSTPKTLNIDGKTMPLSEIIEDKAVMTDLVYGNSNFVEQIYK